MTPDRFRDHASDADLIDALWDQPEPAEYADLAGAASTRRITTTPTWCETCNADVWACRCGGKH